MVDKTNKAAKPGKKSDKPPVDIFKWTVSDFAYGSFVIVRCRHSGVMCGRLRQRKGQEVLLRNARRIWGWGGANTLNELSLRGADCGKNTRISECVPLILLLDAIEILVCTDEAASNLKQSRWPGDDK